MHRINPTHWIPGVVVILEARVSMGDTPAGSPEDVLLLLLFYYFFNIVFIIYYFYTIKTPLRHPLFQKGVGDPPIRAQLSLGPTP